MQFHEVFPAFQGEGRLLGRECVFIRLSKCPVECRWCDTAFTWDGTEDAKRASVEEIADFAAFRRASKQVTHAVISGGEPMVWRKQLPKLIQSLRDLGFTSFEIETAGVLEPTEQADDVFLNVSPKLPSAEAKMLPDPVLLGRYMADPGATLKFVIQTPTDWKAMERLIAKIEHIFEPIDPQRIYVMPEAQTFAQLAARQAAVIEAAAGSGYNVTTRMQVIAFDTQRGK